MTDNLSKPQWEALELIGHGERAGHLAYESNATEWEDNRVIVYWKTARSLADKGLVTFAGPLSHQQVVLTDAGRNEYDASRDDS